MKGVCFCMSEEIYRLNEGGLLLYAREDIPTQGSGCAFVCPRRYTDSMEGLLLYVREDIPNQSTGLLLHVRKDIPAQ